MDDVYLWSAVGGGGLLILQVLLMLIGGDDFDGEGDIDVDGGGSTLFFKALSLKTIVAFFTFFGLAGVWSTGSGWSTGSSLALASITGMLAFFVIGWVMNALMELQSSGTIQLEDAIGQTADVYLRIPGKHKGHGKVTVTCGGRTHQAKAVTSGEEIPTGRSARIVGMSSPGTLDVIALDEET